MKNIKIIIPAMLLLAACSKDNLENHEAPSPAVPGTTVQAARLSVTRPFKAAFYTSVDPNTSIPPTACSGDIPGFANPGIFIHGSATYLGELIPQLSRIQDVSCDLSVTTMLLTTVFSGQLTASNGDAIYITGNDVIDASTFLTGAGTTGTISGTWNISGGTGRFQQATGSFTINGPVDFATTSFRCECVGTINF